MKLKPTGPRSLTKPKAQEMHIHTREYHNQTAQNYCQRDLKSIQGKKTCFVQWFKIKKIKLFFLIIIIKTVQVRRQQSNQHLLGRERPAIYNSTPSEKLHKILLKHAWSFAKFPFWMPATLFLLFLSTATPVLIIVPDNSALEEYIQLN